MAKRKMSAVPKEAPKKRAVDPTRAAGRDLASAKIARDRNKALMEKYEARFAAATKAYESACELYDASRAALLDSEE